MVPWLSSRVSGTPSCALVHDGVRARDLLLREMYVFFCSPSFPQTGVPKTRRFCVDWGGRKGWGFSSGSRAGRKKPQPLRLSRTRRNYAGPQRLGYRMNAARSRYCFNSAMKPRLSQRPPVADRGAGPRRWRRGRARRVRCGVRPNIALNRWPGKSAPRLRRE